MPPIDLQSTTNTHLPLFQLPQEILDLIFTFIFPKSNLDIGPTRDAELRIFSQHLILRRTWPVPPPSWKGCRNVFRTCKAFYAIGLEFLYPQMSFSIRINGDDDDPGQTRSRLHSDYPFGRLDECLPLRYLRAVQVSMSAGAVQELSRLEMRVQAFERAVERSQKLRVAAIRLSLGRLVVDDEVYEQVRNMMGTMLNFAAHGEIKDEALLVKVFTNPGNDVPERMLRDLADLVRMADKNASVLSYSKGIMLL